MRLATCAGFVNHRLRRMAPLARPLLAWLFVGAAAVNGMGGEERVDFARQIRPILVSRCFRCHGQLKEESGLRLDRADAMIRGGDRGAALVAGRADESLLLQAVVGTDDLVMPPEGDRLTDEQIALIRRWIDQGAELSELSGGEHWAFVQPVRPPLPSVVRSDWVRNPIDTFLAAEHEKHQLVPASAAPKHILLRRVYLDLIGLPPTPEEVESFLADDAADAYERVVDDLLARAQYGERWGRHWMDVWRYSDWSGYRNEVRNSQPHIWRWRDWIVGSLNSDKPYDRMILEMLAADEIAPEDDAVLPATGFLVRNWYKFNRNTWLENTVEHTAKSMLGITMGCARCHDHMYDPITQEDYYRFRAFFEAYDVRTDRIPGQADTALDGLPRVYDAKLDAPTYLFVRGDERHPDQSRSLSPALPALFGGELAIQRVMLPVTARYPALRAFVMSETREAVDAELERAEAGLAAARTALLEQARKTAAAAAAAGTAPDQPETSQPETAAENASTRTLARAEATLLLAEKTQLAARAKRESVLARLAAEQARYATAPGDQTDTDRLAAAAASLQRDAQLAQAERDLLRAEQALSQALDKQRQNPDDAKVSKAAADAKKTLEDAREKRDAALAAKDKAITARNAGQTDTAYEPLGEVYPPTAAGGVQPWLAGLPPGKTLLQPGSRSTTSG